MTKYFRSADADYQQLQGQLLPRGRIWQWVGTRLGSLLLGLGGEWSRVHNRLLDLLLEADPRTADELLDDWLSALGQPGECGGDLPEATADKQALAHGSYVASGGNTPAYFIGVAAALGITITIDESRGPFRVEDRVGGRLYGTGWIHTWVVVAPSAVESTRLAELLECLFRRQKPAHTRVLFEYSA